MSFRLRIFLLVMLIAVTAIGATGWLTLSLTSREVTRTEQATDQHRQEIVETVAQFGLTRGQWSGLDQVAAELSRRTGLHLRLQTSYGETLVDTDVDQGRRPGPVQLVGYSVDPRPELKASIARQLQLDFDPSRAAGVQVRAKTAQLWISPIVPTNLFGPDPTDPIRGSAVALMLRQVAQYRAGLAAMRCVRPGSALPLSTAPYLTPEVIAANPGCVETASEKVLKEQAWLADNWARYEFCTGPNAAEPISACFQSAFLDGAGTTAADLLQVYLGATTDTDLGELGRPAAFGVAGLIVVALAGTILIARRVSHPVRQLTEASRLLATGRSDVRVPASGKGELARLSASFNTMAEAVQRSEERQRRLVADVAHEMRTPLSNLRGYLEGLSDGVVEPSRELFASLHEETLLQRRILDDLQVLADAEAGDLGYDRTEVDLAELAGASATAQRAVATEAGVELTVDAPAPVVVRADADRIRQVLGNLLSNAIRYTDAGGKVLVRVRADDGAAVLTVSDNGVGIAPDDVRLVFDRFWRADPARQRATGGSGLGLTIAQRIITDHGGRIEATSEPGQGTTFTVRLPRP